MLSAIRSRLGIIIGRRPARLQVGAICLRGPEDAPEVLLITSRGTGRWIIPKGWPMPGRSLADAALQEAWEEAGIRGTVGPSEIGRYEYDKAHDEGFSLPCEVHVFVLRVTEVLADFPERAERRRQWFTLGEAAKLVAEPGLRALLRGLVPARS